jgi:hypothetical protein
MNRYVFEEFAKLRNISEEDIPLYKSYLDEHPDAKIKKFQWNGKTTYSIWDWVDVWECVENSRRQAIKKYLRSCGKSNLNGIRVSLF